MKLFNCICLILCTVLKPRLADQIFAWSVPIEVYSTFIVLTCLEIVNHSLMHVNLSIVTDGWNLAVVFSSCYYHPTEHEGQIGDSTSCLSSPSKAQTNCLHFAFIPNAMLLYSEFLHRCLLSFIITKQNNVIEQSYLMDFCQKLRKLDLNCDGWIYALTLLFKCLNYWI